jgi:cyclohexanone monooxygenase
MEDHEQGNKQMSRVFDGFEFDPAALKKKYDHERDKRLKLRPEGDAQFVRMKGVLAHYLEDPYTKREDRLPRKEEVDVAIAGGGFGGLLAAARLRELGIDNIRILERGGDFGGTWYWNRYPGAACDVEAYVYLPLLEETGTIPSAKYVEQPEIFAHVRAIAKKYDLYPRALLHTVVQEARFDEKTSRWIVTTDRGDEIRAKFFVQASGHYGEPKLPGIPGIESFKKHSFHTSRWDYDYTGGSATTGLPKLQDKVVGIIGTGATAIQCVPHLGKWAKQLYVFQRTPSSVDFRDNQPTDPDWFKSLPPGWQLDRMRNFLDAMMGVAEVDLVNDGWTKHLHKIMKSATPDLTREQFIDLRQMAEYSIMEGVRTRVGNFVKDNATAEALKPWYNWLCKRPCFHDEYLDTFNRPNVTLVDTDGRGVERLSEDGVFANGQEFKVDCLIYASGFELAPYVSGTPIPLYGRGGLSLAEKWKDGATTLHGVHVLGFPNLLLLATRQSAWSNNFPHTLEASARHIAHLVRHVQDNNVDTIEVKAEAEAAWVRFHESVSLNGYWENCTPSYFNKEGKPEARFSRDGAFGGGVLEFIEILQKWREKGDFEGLTLTSRNAR